MSLHGEESAPPGQLHDASSVDEAAVGSASGCVDAELWLTLADVAGAPSVGPDSADGMEPAWDAARADFDEDFGDEDDLDDDDLDDEDEDLDDDDLAEAFG